jgi:hypothetical protein
MEKQFEHHQLAIRDITSRICFDEVQQAYAVCVVVMEERSQSIFDSDSLVYVIT